MTKENRADHQAFPVAWCQSTPTPGMTLREYFAAQALIGMGNWWPTMPGDYIAKAVWAYSMADAMLKVGSGEHERT